MTEDEFKNAKKNLRDQLIEAAGAPEPKLPTWLADIDGGVERLSAALLDYARETRLLDAVIEFDCLAQASFVATQLKKDDLYVETLVKMAVKTRVFVAWSVARQPRADPLNFTVDENWRIKRVSTEPLPTGGQ